MTDFKVGDRVRRTGDNFEDIKTGDEGIVEAVILEGAALVLEGYEFRNGFSSSAFELVEEKEEPVTFKVGDKVRGIIAGSGVVEGEIYTVSHVNDSSSGFTLVTVLPVTGGERTTAYTSRFELVVEEETVSDLYDSDGKSITLDAYDPGLLPLFTKAAEAADKAGYCNEYDNIAAAIGAPSRAEIKALNAPADPLEKARQAFAAIPLGHTFHFTAPGEYRTRKHIKVSDTQYLHDRGRGYAPLSGIEGYLSLGIEAN